LVVFSYFKQLFQTIENRRKNLFFFALSVLSVVFFLINKNYFKPCDTNQMARLISTRSNLFSMQRKKNHTLYVSTAGKFGYNLKQ